MRTNSVAAAWRQALRVVLAQVGVTLVLAAAGWIWGQPVAWSMLAGGGIGVVATAYLLLTMVKRSLRVTRGLTAGTLFFNWFIKVALTISLLFIALRSPRLQPLLVLAGWATTLLAYWVVLVFFQVKYANGVDGK